MKKLNVCAPCEGLSAETPVEVWNRSGLSAVSYRTGDYARFRESMLTRLSRLRTPEVAALRRLSTRSTDDFSIALLDAWAIAADVLTFYQERIANEAYLGTATEQLSIVELARLIGYELNPGVAASTFLAFTVEEATLAMAQAAINGVARGKEENPPLRLEAGTKVQSIPAQDEEAQTFETVETIEARAEWNAMKPQQSQAYSNFLEAKVIALKGVANDLKAGDVFLLKKGNNQVIKQVVKLILRELDDLTLVYFDPSSPLPKFNLTTPTTNHSFLLSQSFKGNFIKDTQSEKLLSRDIDQFMTVHRVPHDAMRNGMNRSKAAVEADESVFVFRKKATVFGHNAPKEIKYSDSNKISFSEWSLSEPDKGNTISLDSTYDQIVSGGFVAIQEKDRTLGASTVFNVSSVETRTRNDYGVSGKITQINVGKKWHNASNFSDYRGIIIHAQSEQLLLAEISIDSAVGGTGALEIALDRTILGLREGRPVIISGERTDVGGAFVSELRFLKEVYLYGGRTHLVLNQSLSYTYVRKTVSINANIAAATHGESIKEVLGSGDATKSFQKFVLKHPPLTFVSAATPSGVISTLEIRVNDLLWREVSSLYERGPEERIFITRQDDQGKTSVMFGDGKNGARLPSGTENVRASYRKGIGANGLLKANQLSQLLSRPLGLKAVTNPLPPEGAQSREQLAEARSNATLTMFTLGRVVSLKDYEDFARAFAGIAKALATYTWSGHRREIFLTVAGVNGAEVLPESALYKNLLAALRGAGTPGVPLRLVSFKSVFFKVSAKVSVLPDYLPGKVLQAAEKSLREHFSFSKRSFGQDVTDSEVIAVLQNTEGVRYVDLDALYFVDNNEIKHRLGAATRASGETSPALAELLTLDSGTLSLTLVP